MTNLPATFSIPTLDQTTEIPIAKADFLVDGLDHPEGLALGPDGLLYAGGEAGQVYRISVQSKDVETIHSTGGLCLGMAFDGDGKLYICDEKTREVYVRSPDGAVEMFAAGCEKKPFVLPNYPAVDLEGKIYISDSGGWKTRTGRLCRFDRQGHGEVISEQCNAFTNGIALSADMSRIFVVESNLPGVSVIDLHTGRYEVLARFSAGVPDGIAVCRGGDLLVSFYCPSLIVRITPDRRIRPLIYDPENLVLNAPTNIALAGGNRLFAANLGGYHITEIELPWEDEVLPWSRPPSGD